MPQTTNVECLKPIIMLAVLLHTDNIYKHRSYLMERFKVYDQYNNYGSIPMKIHIRRCSKHDERFSLYLETVMYISQVVVRKLYIYLFVIVVPISS